MASALKRMELLAPAGNRECLHAAVCAGADAVYLGLDEFNARRNAENFSLEELPEACDYAHLRGVVIYITMNVEILPDELDRAVACAKAAWEAGADGLIVQDIGLASTIHRLYPEIPLHLSTQMNIHNSAGLEFAAALGAQRVTLARELSLEEISALSQVAAELGLEIECFGHGALCLCYSGQCLMSSLIGGRSANRGLCAQPCRLTYDLYGDDGETPLDASGEHLLSPRDLCTIDRLDELARAGVASLKIEGRMKSADYVYAVVGVYRRALDGVDIGEEGRSTLAEAFSRGFTTAYLDKERGNAMMSYGRPNNRGLFVGRVVTATQGQGVIRTERPLFQGDTLEFWTNRGHFTALCTSDCAAGDTITIAVDEPVGKGDRVFRVRNARMAFIDDPFSPRIALSGEITLRRGEPAFLRLRTAGGIEAEAWGDRVEAARTKEITPEEVRTHTGRMGQTPFSLDERNLIVDLEPGVGIGFSSLHHLRNEVLAALEAALLAPYKDRHLKEVDTLREFPGEVTRPMGVIQPTVVAWATNPGVARSAKKAGAEEIIVPLLNYKRGQATLCGVRQRESEQAGYPKQCTLALPTIDHDSQEFTREGRSGFEFWDYVREGKPVFADNLGDIWRALQEGALVEVGPHIPVTNKASLAFLASLGVKRLWLSPELTLGQIARLAEDSPVPLGITVAGFQELMITEHCLLMSQGECAENCEGCPRRETAHHLTDRKGFDFPVVTDMMGRSHLFNGIELDTVTAIRDFVAMGLSAFMVDTTFMDRETAAHSTRRVLRACEAAQEDRSLEKRPNTTTGHLYRGVS